MNLKSKSIGLLIVIFLIAIVPMLLMVTRRVSQWMGRAAGMGTMTLSRVGTYPITTSTEYFDVQVYVYTGGAAIKSRGVDVVLTFPTNLLQLQSITTDAVNTTALKLFAPVNSTTYDFDAATVIAAANAGSPLGTLSFGAVPVTKISPLPPSPTPPFAPGVAPNDAFAGSIQLATLRFKPLAVGNGTISFSHTVDNKNDSNVASYDLDASGLATDLLNTVTNLPVTITGETCVNGTLGNLNCTGTIDGTDLSLMLIKWAPNGPVPTPATGQTSADIAPVPVDGKVDATDLSKLLLNFGK